MMTKETGKVTKAGAVEIDEAALDDVAGGASDYLLQASVNKIEIEGVKSTSNPLEVKLSPGAIRGQKV